MPTWILLAAFGVALLGACGFVVYGLGTGEQHDIVRAERGANSTGFRSRVIRPINNAFLATRTGTRIATALIHANVRRLYAVEYVALAVLVVFGAFLILNRSIATFYAAVLAAGLGWLLWALLGYLKERQRERFLQQLPEFARIMANSTGAGLSIQTALRVAANEMPDPAGRELTALERELSIGTPLEVGLERMAERIPGRDLHVLVSTLAISQRAGGSLISALRGMSETLEDRKATKPEGKTLVTQASYTGYMVVAVGLGFVLLMNAMSPGVLYKLTSTIVGQVGLFVAAGSYLFGLFLINRMVRVKI